MSDDDMHAMIESAVRGLNMEMLGNLSERDQSKARLVMHDLVSRATRQWAPVRDGTIVISLGRVVHWSCAASTDQIEALMDLVDTDRESPVFRCRLCNEEMAIFFNYVTASELLPSPEAKSEPDVEAR